MKTLNSHHYLLIEEENGKEKFFLVRRISVYKEERKPLTKDEYLKIKRTVPVDWSGNGGTGKARTYSGKGYVK